MANREIQPPGGDLGVKSSGRRQIADLLTLNALFGGRGGRGGRGGGGRTKREMQNDMALMEHQFRLQDELERARTARGVEGATQTDANAYANASRFFAGGQMIGVNDAHGNPIISEEELNRRPDQGSFKGSGGTAASWNGVVRPNEQGGPEVPEVINDPGDDEGDTPPINPDMPFTTSNTRKAVRSNKGKKAKPGSLRVVKDKLSQSQVDEANLDYADFRKANMEQVASLGEEWDDTYEDEIKQTYLQQKFPMQDKELSGLSSAQKRAHKESIYDGPPAAVPSVDDSGAIDTGSVGNRPAPKGESGNTPGNQFK